jgi:hypothetical protein
MANSKFLKLTQLLVNTENYRFEPVASQKEAIDLMVEDQGDKLFNLAKHIVTNGLNPNDRIQVIASNHEKGKFIVLEGNRRTVALKVLTNPDLIEGVKQGNLKKKLKKLHETYSTTVPKTVECTIYDDPVEASKWIKIKHSGQYEGVGTVEWNGQQVQRYVEKVEGKSSIALQVVKLMHTLSEMPVEIKRNLNNLPITSLDRLISDPDVRTFLGIELNNGIVQSTLEPNEVEKGLIQIAKDLLDPDFKVKKIYTKDDRRDYISKFPKVSRPDFTNKAAKPWQPSSQNPSAQNSAPAAKTTIRATPAERSVLIPKNPPLKISSNYPKVNAIYHELLKVNVNSFPNAAAVLFRVFVELSIDCYIESNKLSQTLSSTNSGLGLQAKINQVAHHLETKKQADTAICKGIRAAIKDKNDILGIDTWHAYVHNNRFSASPGNLLLTWNNMQDFMVILWNNI